MAIELLVPTENPFVVSYGTQRKRAAFTYLTFIHRSFVEGKNRWSYFFVEEIKFTKKKTYNGLQIMETELFTTKQNLV